MAADNSDPFMIVPFCTDRNKEYWVYKEECEFIQKRRLGMNRKGATELFEDYPTTKNSMVGLCLSGGGIRSATFNLGFMQALYKARVLQRVDYLSTVSGGGYIGSCLTALLSSGSKNCQTIQDEAKRKACDPLNAKDLQGSEGTAQTGQGTSQVIKGKTPCLWSDTIFPFANPFSGKAGDRQSDEEGALPMGDDPAERAPLRHLRYYSNYLTAEGGFIQKYLGPVLAVTRGLLFNLLMILSIIILVASALAAIYQIPEMRMGPLQLNCTLKNLNSALVERAQAKAGFEAFVFRQTQHVNHPMEMSERIEMVMYNPDLRPEVGALRQRIQKADDVVRSNWWAMLAIPALALAAMVLFYGLMFILEFWRGQEAELKTRFAFSKVFSIILFACLGVLVIQAFGAAIIYWEQWKLYQYKNLSIISLLTFLGPLLLKNTAASNDKGHKPWVKIIISIILMALAPLALLCFTGYCVDLLIFKSDLRPWFTWIPSIGGLRAPWLDIAGAFFIGVVLLIITNNWFNINKFSLHNFYRDRLCRAYLIQDRRKKKSDWLYPFAQVSPDDSIKLSEIYSDGGPILGPYHIINANLNLKKDPPNLDGGKANFRKGESFIFSKLRCGSQKTGYVRTAPYELADHHINLGTAMAISGAAVNIGMGMGDMPTFRLLMGLLNIRLGYWALNPKKDKKWPSKWRFRKAPGTWEGLCEWFGRYTLNAKYINLSDGGHFDNIGVYEMLRRRCKYIIVGDAEADPDMKFQALANLIRLALIDFSIIIDIDIAGLKKSATKNLSGQHCAMGTIKYPKCGSRLDEEIGYLFYCKSSLTGDEPAHLYEYRINHPDFPHQSTSDQWFNERQFEVYRELGFHVGYESFFSAADMEEDFHMEELFIKLKQFWRPRSLDTEERFDRHAAELNGIYARIKEDKDLSFMDSQIYPEWEELMHGSKQTPPTYMWLPEEAKERRAGFYVCNQMIQLMENVYLGLNLEEQFDHPDNRGWMNLFMHWSWAGIFRVTWAISACTFGAKFQNFCQRRLKLKTGEIKVEDWGRKYKKAQFGDGDSEAFEPNALDRTALMAVMTAYGNGFEKMIADKHIPYDDGRHRSCYGFNVVVKNPLNPKEAMSFCFGFAFTLRSDGDILIEFLRIQDHLRRMGLGRWALDKLVRAIVAEKASDTRTPMEVLDAIKLPDTSVERSAQEMKVLNLLASVKTEIRQDILNPGIDSNID